ncbi:hypothetical protein PHSY_005177 [Pseudozyma hubeiensis SY62]|uniref:Uncharacterized protein n=1 Tax=Pseudozyma hubeiensis (strain SY62) TaxID=1305764 RepID=R9P894_PSEHS|nr:hypothetical protein PHSY_005177 [Pseudozyma hubeiensis SY62]GAC97591.1 hypothetical protein PHSY_005177 [Pseudozyma hubeiensis SY62]
MSASALPATPSSASSPSKARICKKLVVKGHASNSASTYTLYLKVHLPTSHKKEGYVLLAHGGVELHDAIVHRLDESGAAPALSTSAATAANVLGIPLSIDHGLNDSFIDYAANDKSKEKHSAARRDHSDLPAVVQSDDGKITIRPSVRPSPRSEHTSATRTSSSAYMVTLHLQVKPLSTPPYAPYSVRLAVPVCLNNYMRFTVDESIDTAFGLHGMAVEVDPPILPVSAIRKPLRRKDSSGSSHRASSVVSLSDDEADLTLLGADSVDDSEPEHDDTAIAGPFQACDALVLRIAAQQAGDFISVSHPLRVWPNALRAEKALSTIRYLPQKAEQGDSEDEATTVEFEATLHLYRPYFPGLDREVQLYLQLDSAVSPFEWHPTTVDVSTGILSWSFGPLASSSPPTSQQSGRSLATSQVAPSAFEIGDLVVLPEPSQQTADDEDLLSVAPPKGINDADFDFSLDNAATTPNKQRRFSLQSSTSFRLPPSTPSSEPSEPSISSSNVLSLTLSLLPVLQIHKPLSICAKGSMMLPATLATAFRKGDLSELPRGLVAPASQIQSFGEVTLASVDAEKKPWLLEEQLNDSLVDSRETVLQSHEQEKPSLVLRDTKAINFEEAEVILRRALAIIAAHDGSSRNADRTAAVVARQGDLSGRNKQRTGSSWILPVSHLLWTLFLTAMVLMLFNAGQNANRALSAKLDELSRLLEISAQSTHPTTYHISVPLESNSSPNTPAVRPSSMEEGAPGSLDNDPLNIPDNAAHTMIPSEAEQLDEVRTFWQDPLVSESKEVDMKSAQLGLSHFVSSWVRDLLRAPFLVVRQLLGIFIGTR